MVNLAIQMLTKIAGNISAPCTKKHADEKTVIVSLKTKVKSADEIIGAIDWTVDI